MRPLKLVPDNTNIPFLKYRNIAMAFSMLLIIGSLALVAARGFNLGIDFVGGQMVRVTFDQPVNIEKLRGTVESLGQGEASIQQFGPKEVAIRTPLPDGDGTPANRAAFSTSWKTARRSTSSRAPLPPVRRISPGTR